MIRTRALTILAAEVDDQTVASGDPLVSMLARRLARRARKDAELATTESDAKHVARLAYLFVLRELPDGSFDDVALVTRAFEQARKNAREPMRRSWVTIAVALTTLLGTTALAFALWPRYTFDARRQPVGKALGVDLASYAVALGKNRMMPYDATSAALGTSALRRTLGDTHALEDLPRTMALVARGDPTDVGPRDQFRLAVGAANALFVQAKAPYYLDDDILVTSGGFGQPIVFSYYVERVDTGKTADATVRVNFLWRLDGLNVRYPYIGYTHPRAGAALVLLDQIEHDLIVILPALRPGEPLELCDHEPSTDPARASCDDAEREAGDIVRTELGAAGLDGAKLQRLGELLAKRRDIIKKWNAELPLVGAKLIPPWRLVPESDYASDLRHRVPRASLDEWDAVHAELLSADMLAFFETVRDRYAHGTERHEIQHRLDYTRGLVPVPAHIADRLGIQNPLDAPATGFAGRCRDETSAYLAELAHSEGLPRIELVLLSRQLFDEGHWGGVYACAAQMVFELMQLQLGITGDRIVARGAVNRTALQQLIHSLPNAETLHSAASTAWQSAYGATLPSVAIETSQQNTRWRH